MTRHVKQWIGAEFEAVGQFPTAHGTRTRFRNVSEILGYLRKMPSHYNNPKRSLKKSFKQEYHWIELQDPTEVNSVNPSRLTMNDQRSIVRP